MYKLVEKLLGEFGEVLQVIKFDKTNDLDKLVQKGIDIDTEFEQCGFLTIDKQEVFAVKHEFYRNNNLIFETKVYA